MTRRYDTRRARVSLSYTTSELAELFEVTLSTVYAWVRDGLVPIDCHRPYLFAGPAVAAFLRARNKPRQPLEDGQIYCVACKKACRPDNGIAELLPRGETTADVVGTCPFCFRRVFRRVRLDELSERAGNLILHHEDGTIALEQLGDRPHSANCHQDRL